MLILAQENDHHSGLASALAGDGKVVANGNEIVITRDGQPVAKFVRVSAAARKRPRWSMEEHARWQKKVSGGRVSRSDAALPQGRADRVLTGKRK